jgi:hypothetical protein
VARRSEAKPSPVVRPTTPSFILYIHRRTIPHIVVLEATETAERSPLPLPLRSILQRSEVNMSDRAKMSWQAYVDEHLMCEIEGHHLAAAAIVGHDGAAWAQSTAFPEVRSPTTTHAMQSHVHVASYILSLLLFVHNILRELLLCCGLLLPVQDRGHGQHHEGLRRAGAPRADRPVPRSYQVHGHPRRAWCRHPWQEGDVLLTISLSFPSLLAAPPSFLAVSARPDADCFLRRSQGSGGITVKKTGQALVVGIYDEPMTPGQCNMVVERLGDYLLEQGM